MPRPTRTILAALVLLIVVACPGSFNVEDARLALAPHTVATLEKFSSAEAFDAYVAAVRDASPSSRGWGSPFGCASRTASEVSNAGAAEPSITNNQESGVDEGDIVKAAGDFLVILRRGRLFTVRVGPLGAPTLTPTAQLDVPPPGYTKGSWYDEMLISGDRVVVVGFSYVESATEVVLFRLTSDGGLTHDGHFLLRSNDYYSSRNYASRLVGSRLLFYMPSSLLVSGAASLPAMRRGQGGDSFGAWSDVLQKTETYRPLQLTTAPILHTVVSCELADAVPSCTAQSVVGPRARTFYVSPEAVYVWVSPGYDGLDDTATSVVYRLPLDGSAVTALKAHGAPVDQFSFQQRAGTLNLALVAQGGGDSMWNPELTSGDVMLARFALSDFTAEAPTVPVTAYRRLPQLEARPSLQNRFVGDWLIYGSGLGWSASTQSQTLTATAVAVRVERPETTTRLALEHDLDRVEPLGTQAAVLIGQGERGLTYSSVALGDDAAAVQSQYTEVGATQGETRSHGFFFKPDGTGGGMLGLPVRLEGAAWQHLLYGSARVSWLAVSPSLELSSRGALAANDEASREDGCTVSCVDWYGNARPIFYRDRLFALLGYELVEGGLGAGGVEEFARANFLLTP